MGEPSGSSFRPDSVEPHLAGVVSRSSSTRPLLAPASSSLCAPAVAAGAAPACCGTAHNSAAMIAQQHEEEVMMARKLEKVVVMVATSRETPPFPAEVAGDSEMQGKITSGTSVGRLFVTKNSRVEMSLARESDASFEEEEKKEKKKKKKKKKKSSSWWPDPERRWPIQGFY